MRYIYYIAGIMVVLTLVTMFGWDNLKVELSEPAITINNRNISKQELDTLVKSRSTENYHMADVLDSIITNQLLIQEAVRQGINKEESFRQSIQSYYEQSLVKVLIDRKYNSMEPVISDAMIEKYRLYSSKTLEFTKSNYNSLDDLTKGKTASSEAVKEKFINLAGQLQFILLSLATGETSYGIETDDGYVTYRLEKIEKLLHPIEDNSQTDTDHIKRFLSDQKKRLLFDAWVNDLRKNADIKILTDVK